MLGAPIGQHGANMRSILSFPLFFAACASQSAPVAPVATPEQGAPRSATASIAADEHLREPSAPGAAERTHFEWDGLALDLPGGWVEHPLRDAHELRKGDNEQIIISRFPTVQGLDTVASAARLAEIQPNTTAKQCKRTSDATTPVASTIRPQSLRSHVVCESPRVVATFVVAPLKCDVFSFEHYWYGARAFSPELDRADDAILTSLRIKPETGDCP